MLSSLRALRWNLAILFCLVASTLSAQQLKGTWQGVIPEAARDLVFTAVFNGSGKGTLEVLGRKVEISSVTVDGESVEFRAGDRNPAVFTGKLAGGIITGTFQEDKVSLPFRMEREPDLPPPADRVEAWRQDLEFARRKLLKFDRSFTPPTREAFAGAITKLVNDVPGQRDDQIIVRLARAVALADNGHTRMYLLRNRTELARYPLRVWWFRDGPYVVRAAAERRFLLGCRVVSIAGTKAAEVRQRLAPLYAGSPAWDDYMASYLITSPDILAGTGVLKQPGASEWKFRCASGTQTARLDPLPLVRQSTPVEAWWDLLPGDSRGAPGMAGVKLASPPLYLQHADKNYWFERLPNGLLYFQFNRAADDAADPMAAFSQRLLASVRGQPPSAVIVDLRFNTGGDLGVGRTLMERLHQSIGDAKVYAVSGRATFSAGLYHLAQWTQWTGTTVVGEGPGDRLEFWAEGGNLRLPNSGLTLHFANGFHTYSGRPHPGVTAFAELSAGSVKPSPEVRMSFAEYSTGRDPALDSILKRTP